MDNEMLKGKWDRVKDRLKVRWSKLTDDDLKRVEVRHGALAGVLQRRYSLSGDKAETDSKAFFGGLDAKAEPLASAPGTNVAKLTTPAPGALAPKPGATAPATNAGKTKTSDPGSGA